MALEALGFPNDHMLFNYTFGNSSVDHPNYMEMMPKMVLNGTFPTWEMTSTGGGNSHAGGSSIEWDSNSSSTSNNLGGFCPVVVAAPLSSSSGVVAGRRKRRRSKGCKNKEEVENQRMTHIAVERNRRKQMNEYLAVLRSLMPPSYVQRGDQASIVGGAINFVKELEQLLQTLEARKRVKSKNEYGTTDGGNTDNNADLNSTSSTMSSLFGDLFSLNHCKSPVPSGPSPAQRVESVAENKSAVADVEVTLVESHANVKILSRRRPRQLLKIIGGFQSLNLTVLHLNVTSVEDMVLYSMSAKVEEECQISSVDEIASAVHQIMGRIHADQDSLITI